MAEQSQSEFMTNNNPYTSLPTRAENESLYAYLMRLAQARGGMLMGQYSPTVDDVVAEEITTQPLGVLIKQDTGDGGDNNETPMTPEEQEAMRRGKIERAVGMLTGQTNPMVYSLGGTLGIPGAIIGGIADWDANATLDKQLEAAGYSGEVTDMTYDQIQALRDNPAFLNQQLTTGNLGFGSQGYKQGFFDDPGSVIGNLFSDILGSKPEITDFQSQYRAGGSGGFSIPGITSLSQVNPMTQTYPGAVNFGAPLQTGMLSWGAPGVNTVYAPGYTPATAATGFRATSPYGFGMMTQPTVSTVSNTTNTGASSVIGQQAYGGTVVGVDATGNLNIDRTGNGIADVRTGVSPNTGLVNTYNFNIGDNVSSGGTGTAYQGPSPVDGGSGSDFGSYSSGSEDNASNDWGGFGSEDGWD